MFAFEALFVLFSFAVLCGLLLSMLSLIGCSVYDIAATSEKVNPTAASKNKLRTYRPLVSIVIPMFNESATIERCLEELKKVRYRNLEIIVADDKSTDDCKRIARTYIKQHPERNIKLVGKRKNGGRGAAINLGAKHATGEILVAFDADCEFHPYAIHRLVEKFADPKVSAVAANVRINDDGTILGLLQRLEYLVSFRSKKFNTVTRSEFIIGGAGASYRISALREVKGFDESMKTEDIELSMRMTRKLGMSHILAYASDYVVYTAPVPTYRSLFKQRFRWKFGSLQALYANRSLVYSVKRSHNPFTSWVRLPLSLFSEFMLLLEPLLFSAFVYMAITNKNPELFIGACCVYIGTAWLAIWSDEHLSRRDVVYLSFIALFMYPTSIIMSAVQVVAAFRSLANYQSLFGLKHVSGAYTTTQRAIVKAS